MHRILFAAMLGLILASAPDLFSGGLAYAKGDHAGSGGSASGPGKGKSDPGGASKNGSNAKGNGAPSVGGQSDAKGSGSNKVSSSAGASGSAFRRQQGQIRPEWPFWEWRGGHGRCRAKHWRPVGLQEFRVEQRVIQCRNERGIRRRQRQIRPGWLVWEWRRRHGRCRAKPERRLTIQPGGGWWYVRRQRGHIKSDPSGSSEPGDAGPCDPSRHWTGRGAGLVTGQT